MELNDPDLSPIQRDHLIYQEALRLRDTLEPIIKGVIEKAKRDSQFDLDRTFRKTTLKDARELARLVIWGLNRLALKIHEGRP